MALNLQSLPNELLLEVGDHLPTADLSALQRTNKRLNGCLHFTLLKRAHEKHEGCPAIIHAAVTNNLSLIECLSKHREHPRLKVDIEATHTVDQRPRYPQVLATAIYYAARSGHAGAVQALVDAGADSSSLATRPIPILPSISFPTEEVIRHWDTPIHAAAQRSHFLVVGLLGPLERPENVEVMRACPECAVVLRRAQDRNLVAAWKSRNTRSRPQK